MGFSLAYALLAASTSASSLDGRAFAQLTIERRVVIRVPIMPVQPVATQTIAPLRLKEAKGPKCLLINRLAGASLASPELVDLYIRNATPIRARLSGNCRNQVDLRYGFYLKPTKDGKVCGGRDSVHARTGGQCEIERFHSLVPER